jgi:hypothetical protein
VAGIVALGAAALAGFVSAGSTPKPLYSVGATKACLESRRDAIAGLPPATPPSPPALFVYSFRSVYLQPRVHGQLGAWYGHKGKRGYEGIVLAFTRSANDARAALASSYWSGASVVRNVIVARDQSAPTASLRKSVIGCLRSKPDAAPGPTRPTPRASLATFAGYWGGHSRGLRITSDGRAFERVSSGCCDRLYELAGRILSVSGTLTRADATYRVTSFKHYDPQIASLRKGEVGTLRLRNGIVTNTLTKNYFCSDPAWGATQSCGA